MSKKTRSLNKNLNYEQRRIFGLRIQNKRRSLPPDKSLLSYFAKSLGMNESLLSRIESGNASFPLEKIELLAEVAGCREEEILYGNAYPDFGKHPFNETLKFLQQAAILGVDGLFTDRAASLGHLLAFAERMRKGKLYITASSARGIEQRTDHLLVQRLMEMGPNDHFEVRVIMTHPKLGSKREYLERRPTGSIIREILTGINWFLDVWQIKPIDIRLSKANPSSFCIFLVEGPEGRGIINPYPTMRQAFLSYTLAVHKVAAGGGAGEAVSIFQNYLTANFEEPWQDSHVTEGLVDGLEKCIQIIEKKEPGSEELGLHREQLERTYQNCLEKGNNEKKKEEK